MGPCGEGQPDCNTGNAFGAFYGTGPGLAATPLLGVGIPMWVRGQKRLREGSAPSLGVYGSKGGATRVVLTGRF